MRLKTRYEQMTTPGALDSYKNFLGRDDEYKDWYGIVGRSRDSGVLEESNFDVALKRLGGEGDDVRVERYGHWAVGWIEEIYVRPNSKALAVAEEIAECLAEHPVLDEEDFFQRESEEAEKIWADMSVRDRANHFAKHQRDWSTMEGLWDLIQGIVRGEYYGGSAETLVR